MSLHEWVENLKDCVWKMSLSHLSDNVTCVFCADGGYTWTTVITSGICASRNQISWDLASSYCDHVGQHEVFAVSRARREIVTLDKGEALCGQLQAHVDLFLRSPSNRNLLQFWRSVL